MQLLFYKYLVLTGHVEVENLGTFSIAHNAPTYQTVQQTLVAPYQQIAFSSNAITNTSKGFVQYIATQLQVSSATANEQLQQQVQYLYEQVNKLGTDDWYGIGTFKKNNEGELIVLPSNTSVVTTPNITAAKVVRKDATHAIMVGEAEKTNTEMLAYYNDNPIVSGYKWYIAAAVIATFTIAYLVYYYITKGSF